MGLPISSIRNIDDVRRALQKIKSNILGPKASPIHAGLTLTGLTASRLVQTNSSKGLASVSNLANWIAGTANEIDITDDGDGTITIGIVNPLIVGKGGTGTATLTDHSILLGSGTAAITALGAATNGQLPIGSTGADPVLAGITGTSNQIIITNGAGSITLSAPQDLHTGATNFTVAGATISGLTAGRIPFAGTGGLISDDASLLWDNTNKYFEIGSADASDKITIYHNNFNTYFRTTDGGFRFISAEGTNHNTEVNIYGLGTGYGILNIFDEDDTTSVALYCSNSVIYWDAAGTPSRFSFIPSAITSLRLFEFATEGETQEIKIYGYRTGSGSRKSLEIGTEVDAADTASFDGLSNYWFDGILKSTNGALLGDGGTTNYTEVEADGTLEFHGTATVWNDANVGAMTLTLPVASQPDEVNFVDEAGGDTGIATWGYAIGEKSSGSIEIPHDYKEGSDITFHVHWQGIAAPTGTDYVKWQLTYTVAAADGEETLDAATTITVETAFDTQYEFKLSSFSAITGTNFQIGDQFLFTLERIAATGDAYAGDALIATVGLHYECDTVGSRQMLSKT